MRDKQNSAAKDFNRSAAIDSIRSVAVISAQSFPTEVGKIEALFIPPGAIRCDEKTNRFSGSIPFSIRTKRSENLLISTDLFNR